MGIISYTLLPSDLAYNVFNAILSNAIFKFYSTPRKGKKIRLIINVTTQYAAVVVGGFTVLLLYYVISYIIRFLYTLSTFFLLKYLVYPYIQRGNTIPKRLTRIFLLNVTLYVIANVLYITIRVKSFAQIGTRASIISLANIIPVIAGLLSIVANYLSFSV